ncbi:MAG: hypothetical protein ACRDK8_15410 [Solirubrobacteraceae bacterium]
MVVDGALVIKLPAGRCAELTATKSGRAFEIGRRRMREWVQIGEIDQARWTELAEEARAFVERAGGRESQPNKREQA